MTQWDPSMEIERMHTEVSRFLQGITARQVTGMANDEPGGGHDEPGMAILMSRRERSTW